MTNKVVRILAPVLNNQKLVWPIIVDGHKDEIELEFSSNVSQYIVFDRIDSIVAGLLVFCIRNSFDIESEFPITDEFLYNLTQHFIPAVAGTSHQPKITSPVVRPLHSQGNIVATGISCGVDSLYTIATHTDKNLPTGIITHLAFFDAGSNHSDMGSSKTTEGRRALAKKFAKNYKFGFIEINTTLPEFIERNSCTVYSHVENHTFMMLHCVLSIAKGIHKYYYSSGYGYSCFDCKYKPTGDYDASYYDLLTLSMASFGDLNFKSTGGQTTRLEKIRLLSDYEAAHHFLNVCVTSVDNCNVCFKCARTLLELDAIGKIDEFAEVFDINYYKANRRKYLRLAYIEALKGDKFMTELLPYFKKELTFPVKLMAIAEKSINVLNNRIWSKLKF